MQTMILLGEGYEEVEAITVIDYLRRADIPVDIVSINEGLSTLGDHGIEIMADKMLDDIDVDAYDMVITPGGRPGAEKLAGDKRVTDLIAKQYDNQKYIASICASPIVLNAAGIAGDLDGTNYPGFEDRVNYKHFHEDITFYDADHKVLTSRGPATAVYFALDIIKLLKGEAAAEKIADALLLPMVEKGEKEA
ncbi:DJ-1/PfpI family protein [Aerococcus agrisoli]|uniref:DJ-1/PfpI family protein n=1 Tax=Aerococcus agrisoli TaxID=2487350 RepID=A0A3N4GPC3_9LACT|nr:DJ-1 family glyoxalase III [Aerococcus agrisoli]RPA60470.1 DJ-1/PfpI family protein [Aerococcus agrisoli]